MKIAVLGDLIHDVFIHGGCDRLNPEGPSPLIVHQNTIKKLGGAANVVENLKSLELPVDAFYANTPPSIKTRIIANGQTVCRLDDDKISPPIYLNFKDLTHDLIVLSDYNKGALSDCRELIAKVQGKVFIDPKKDFANYTGAYCIKPNKQEFERFFGPVTNDNLRKFAKQNNHQVVIVTLGSEGVIYYYDDAIVSIPSTTNNVADVTGAGDCFMAAMIYGLSKGFDIHSAIKLGNIGAGVSVKYQGTYILNKNDLIKTKVFTNGCFDILHRGHIDLLEKSKQMGDYLIVGLNSDASVRALKGESRPVHSQEDRKKALEAIKYVDEVVIFDEATPYNLIKKLKPDIITKGGDYAAEQVVGNDLAIVKIIPYVEGYSTTKILNHEK